MSNSKIKVLIKEAAQGIALSQYQLGMCFYRGEEVNQDYFRAVYWFKKAADEIADAKYQLAYCYKYGKGVAQNKDSAIFWVPVNESSNGL